MLSRDDPLDIGIDAVCGPRPVTSIEGVDLIADELHVLAGHRVAAAPEADQAVGVIRYASKTESRLRSRVMHCLSCFVSPTSTTKRFLTIGCLVVQEASRMFIPPSANVRERSSSRQVRSQASTWSSTR